MFVDFELDSLGDPVSRCRGYIAVIKKQSQKCSEGTTIFRDVDLPFLLAVAGSLFTLVGIAGEPGDSEDLNGVSELPGVNPRE